MKQEEKTLADYLAEKRLSVIQFCRICNITADKIYRLRETRDLPITVATIKKIYQGTLAKYGKGLEAHEYLNLK